MIEYINNDISIVHRTKDRVIEKIHSKMKSRRKKYSSGIKVSNEKNLTTRDHQNLFKDKKKLSLTSRHFVMKLDEEFVAEEVVLIVVNVLMSNLNSFYLWTNSDDHE